jgi:hypothetical protein
LSIEYMILFLIKKLMGLFFRFHVLFIEKSKMVPLFFSFIWNIRILGMERSSEVDLYQSYIIF